MSNPSQQDLIITLIFIAAGFFSILVHEYGHALMMKKYGRQPQVVLHGMGGVAMSSGTPFSRTQDFLVSLMGPVAQAALGAIAFFILKAGVELPGLSGLFLEKLMLISFFWAALNLIPMFPMDGGQILASILGRKNMKTVYMIGTGMGILIAIILFTKFPQFASMWNLLILGMLTWENVKGLQRG